MRRVILFTGMGADSRLLRPLHLREAELVLPEHLPAQRDESLAAYARRIAESHAIGAGDVVGGSSFGGMLAAEIAQHRAVAAVILLGSCLDPSRLPRLYALANRYSRWLPDRALKLARQSGLMGWRFRPLTEAAELVLLEMASATDIQQLKEFGRMVMTWPGRATLSCPVLSIHGDVDRVIPLQAAPDLVVVLRDAGHAFTLTHAERTSALIEEFLNGLAL